MCGVIGIVANTAVNQLLYDGRMVLQHRGQDAAGIVTAEENRFHMHKGQGLARDVFRTRDMRNLLGDMGVAHVRYPTAGSASSSAESQPFYVNSPYGIVLGHNGNLTNTHELKESLFRSDLRHDPGAPVACGLRGHVRPARRPPLAVGDLRTFTDFVRLAAGRTACEVNLSRIGADAGVSHNTARAWLSVLEASYLVIRVPGWHPTIRKRVVKAPKLHFIDTGLLCYLLGIREPGQLRHHPLRGAIFETWAPAEIFKRNAHEGVQTVLYHYRDASGTEVDLVVDRGSHLVPIEIKRAAVQGGMLSLRRDALM